MGNRAGSSPVARIKRQVTHWGWLAFLSKEQDLNLSNAMQTRIAGDGWTEPLHNVIKSCCPYKEASHPFGVACFFELTQHNIQQHHNREPKNDSHCGEIWLRLLIPLAFRN